MFKRLAALFLIISLLSISGYAVTDKNWSLTFNNVIVGNILTTTMANTLTNPALLSCIPSIGYRLSDNSVLDVGCMGWSFMTTSSFMNYFRYTYYFGKGSMSPHLALDGAFTTTYRTTSTRDYSSLGLILGTEVDYGDIAVLLDFRLLTIDSLVTTRGSVTNDYRNSTYTNFMPFISVRWAMF